jgi:hypothetical protein
MVKYKNLLNDKKYCLPFSETTCEFVVNRNVNSAWIEYYKKYDLIQYPISTFVRTTLWYKNIPKIPKDQIPIYEKEYIIIPQEFEGQPFLLLIKRGSETP